MKTHPVDFILSGFFTILIFCLSLFPVSVLSGIVTVPAFGDYHVVIDSLLLLLLYGLWSAAILRLMMVFKPFSPGEYAMDDRLFTYWKLFTVIYEFGKGALLPFTTVFAKPLVAKLFGATIGRDIALGGHLVDPQLIQIGDEAVIGHDSVITAHTINSGTIVLKPVIIGARATIGVHAVLMSGVNVGEGAIVAAGSVVPPDTSIPANELWGGIPVKKIKSL
ncbi:acyltransferase [Methylomonas koyamae]|uniref:acyltransferase n=1 Tax=Methylomonas koyamae TaxID=702114 RepID=UPI001129C7A2|nr:DapH/DapD/GlmU-related protein [Methylomonas koyamae]TPQ29623.1 hypothetical protein C2U68_00945 [Methylomonas koyamae]